LAFAFDYSKWRDRRHSRWDFTFSHDFLKVANSGLFGS
jgi:hypothetical protein